MYFTVTAVGYIAAGAGHYCVLLLRWSGQGVASHGDHADGQGDKLSSEQRITVSKKCLWSVCESTCVLRSVTMISRPLRNMYAHSTLLNNN